MSAAVISAGDADVTGGRCATLRLHAAPLGWRAARPAAAGPGVLRTADVGTAGRVACIRRDAGVTLRTAGAVVTARVDVAACIPAAVSRAAAAVVAARVTVTTVRVVLAAADVVVARGNGGFEQCRSPERSATPRSRSPTMAVAEKHLAAAGLTVVDAGDAFSLELPAGAGALDVFHHPFAYADA